jgi:hypothetical protein
MPAITVWCSFQYILALHVIVGLSSIFCCRLEVRFSTIPGQNAINAVLCIHLLTEIPRDIVAPSACHLLGKESFNYWELHI